MTKKLIKNILWNSIHNMIFINMEHNLTNVKIINSLIKKSPHGVPLSEFKNINDVVRNKTIVSMLYGMRNYKYVPQENSLSEIGHNLRININKLLSHPDINFSNPINKRVLFSMMMSTSGADNLLNSYLYMNNKTIDKILSLHKLNPDILLNCNSILRLLDDRLDDTYLAEKINIFIKHGADLELNITQTSYVNQPYITTLNYKNVSTVILLHTKNFYRLGEVLHKLTKSVRVIEIFDHILQYGKMSSFKYLCQKECENIAAYDEWIKNIRNINLDITNMRKILAEPIKRFELISYNSKVDDIVRKMCIFKQNLECLTKNIITVPAYRFYDVAIIIKFLMNNQYLTILSHDILRYIAFFVFNY